jgi:adenine-specific DNA-methyltransferase
VSGYVGVRPWVISHMLDLAGYFPAEDLVQRRIVEPAVGDGSILGAIVQRLSESCHAHGRDIGEAYDSLVAYDVDASRVREARLMVVDLLLAEGWLAQVAVWVAASWIRHADYLLVDKSVGVDHVICRPPYAAFNHIPQRLYDAYRASHRCLTARSDAYIAFMEHGLGTLGRDGNLIMILPTNWLGSHSAGNIRQKIHNAYAIDLLLNLTEADVYDRRISGLNPMICLLRNGTPKTPIVAEAGRDYYHPDGQTLEAWIKGTDSTLEAPNISAHRLTHWTYAPERRWRFRPPNMALNRIHKQHPRLGSHPGIKVSHGIRTGMDTAFQATATDPIEPDRLLPMAVTGDIKSGNLVWQGTHLVSPWDAQGNLVRLEDYPLMADWFGRHREILASRRAIRGDVWYRTNDQVDQSLAGRVKLLLPKMSHRLMPLLDDIGLYPHFHFCYVVSDSWDLGALGGLLLSRIANQLIREHCHVGRGGSLHIRSGALSSLPIPDWQQVSAGDAELLGHAFYTGSVEVATVVAERLYGVEPDEY